jgi:ABC-type transport system involved in multi-copper enzyme maturation permease subunit
MRDRSWRRIRAIARKELREHRRNRSVLVAVAIFPLIFLVQPIALVLTLPASVAVQLSHRHMLLYMLAVPVLTPAVLGAYSVAGERQQESLEPALTTPIRSDEFLLGKALAALAPSLAISYLVYALFIAFVLLFARPGIAPALLRVPDIAAQIVFTPFLSALAIWISVAVSTRMSDVRVAQQLGLLANLPLVLATSLIAFDVIPTSATPPIPMALLLLVADVLGWRLVVPLFNRERLITGTR